MSDSFSIPSSPLAPCETPEPFSNSKVQKKRSKKGTPQTTTTTKTTTPNGTTTVIIIEKTGIPKTLMLKEVKEDDFFKKCGFKSPDGFKKQTEWKVKVASQTYWVSVFAKSNGRGTTENKYDFPPPIDGALFFGNALITAQTLTSVMDTTQEMIIQKNEKKYVSLTLELWKQIYERLFGGFEDLQSNEVEDEDEEDEMSLIPSNKKTKHGYLKDGFVVDGDSTEDEGEDGNEDENEDEDEDGSNSLLHDKETDGNMGSELISMEDLGSELSEEEYDYEKAKTDS
jgi:hypothetical protein